VVGTLTLVVSARGSIALGGLNAAVVGLGSALVGPLLGAAADRMGQRPVILLAGIVNSLVLIAMAAVAFSSLPDAAVLAVGFLIGASSPQIGPLSRSRLLQLILHELPSQRRARSLSGTMGYESAADETAFVFGPVLVALLATTMNPAAPMIGAAVLTLVFVTAFALQPTARPPGRPHRRGRLGHPGPGARAVRPGGAGAGGGLARRGPVLRHRAHLTHGVPGGHRGRRVRGPGLRRDGRGLDGPGSEHGAAARAVPPLGAVAGLLDADAGRDDRLRARRRAARRGRRDGAGRDRGGADGGDRVLARGRAQPAGPLVDRDDHGGVGDDRGPVRRIGPG